HQHMAWAAERAGGGRGFGFTGGHDHWNWGDPNFRKVMLNAIVWCARGEVPATGVESPKLTMKDLESNLDPKNKPANFKREDIQQKLKLPPDDAKGAATPTQATPVAALQPQAQPQQPRQQGQRGGANGGRGRGAAGGIGAAPSRLDFLRIEAVQKELGLAPDKLAALQKLQDAQGRAAGTAARSRLPI